jgi:hypothetical protein
MKRKWTFTVGTKNLRKLTGYACEFTISDDVQNIEVEFESDNKDEQISKAFSALEKIMGDREYVIYYWYWDTGEEE